MNPFKVLNIDPTDDKMAIRRAFVRETKLHHPDMGGEEGQFRLIHKAYEILINTDFNVEIVETEIRLPLNDMLEGCIATVEIKHGGHSGTIFEVTVPAYSYPGTVIEFKVKDSTARKIRVKLLEIDTNEYTRLDSSIIVRKQVNSSEAEDGITIEAINFDSTTHQIMIPPNTTADRLIYNIPGAGFYEKATCVRGNLTIIIEIKNKD